MKYVPHDYQKYATDFILTHPQAAVLLDMGLGKSVITLTAIRKLIGQGKVRRVLVVAPLRVARDTWPAEIEKWDHLKGLTYSVVVGSEKARLRALARPARIYIINRECLHWLTKQDVGPSTFDMIVIDELSSFKNLNSIRFQAMMDLRPCARRIVGLTGTPTSNGLMDLWAQYHLLDQGKRLGKYFFRFREEFFRPAKWYYNRVVEYTLRPGADEEIYRRVSDITISMKAADHLKMPECVMNQVIVRMNPREQAFYDGMRENLVLKVQDQKINAVSAASLCGKLCQMANGAVYAVECEPEDGMGHETGCEQDAGWSHEKGTESDHSEWPHEENTQVIRIHERKLDALEDLIEGANGKPMLVAYWFRHDLIRIRQRFPESREIKTSQDIRDWNDGKITVGLIHPASAGHGLNLQAGGSCLVWFGLTWSLELYQQTNARLWRQGQRAETVVIHHILTANTIDEQIMKALAEKNKTQAALIEAVKAQLNLKEEDAA